MTVTPEETVEEVMSGWTWDGMPAEQLEAVRHFALAAIAARDIAEEQESASLIKGIFDEAREELTELREQLATARAVVNPSECDHEFSDHCVICGVDAHEWFNHATASGKGGTE